MAPLGWMSAGWPGFGAADQAAAITIWIFDTALRSSYVSYIDVGMDPRSDRTRSRCFFDDRWWEGRGGGGSGRQRMPAFIKSMVPLGLFFLVTRRTESYFIHILGGVMRVGQEMYGARFCRSRIGTSTAHCVDFATSKQLPT